MSLFDEEELKRVVLEHVRDEVRARAMAFKATPAGKVASAFGRQVIMARNEKRDLTPEEIQAFVMNIPTILDDEGSP